MWWQSLLLRDVAILGHSPDRDLAVWDLESSMLACPAVLIDVGACRACKVSSAGSGKVISCHKLVHVVAKPVAT